MNLANLASGCVRLGFQSTGFQLDCSTSALQPSFVMLHLSQKGAQYQVCPIFQPGLAIGNTSKNEQNHQTIPDPDGSLRRIPLAEVLC